MQTLGLGGRPFNTIKTTAAAALAESPRHTNEAAEPAEAQQSHNAAPAQEAEESEPPPAPTAEQNADPQIPANIVITVGEQKTYNGDPIVYPNGEKTEESYYGIGRINLITVVDENGDPIKAESGVTIREDVELVSANPADAKNIVNKSEKSDLFFEPDQPGVIIDKVGPLSTNPNTNRLLKELPNFSVTYRQTLTVKDSQGRAVLRQINTITVTNTSVEYKAGKAYVP